MIDDRLVRGRVRKPPPLQSIIRMQQSVGNRVAQRALRIGDGKPVDVPATPERRRARTRVLRWSALALLIVLVLAGALCGTLIRPGARIPWAGGGAALGLLAGLLILLTRRE